MCYIVTSLAKVSQVRFSKIPVKEVRDTALIE